MSKNLTYSSFIVDFMCCDWGLIVQEKTSLLVYLQQCNHSYHLTCFVVQCRHEIVPQNYCFISAEHSVVQVVTYLCKQVVSPFGGFLVFSFSLMKLYNHLALSAMLIEKERSRMRHVNVSQNVKDVKAHTSYIILLILHQTIKLCFSPNLKITKMDIC